MKILHTSDWHLDCSLVNHRRTDEHQAFLDWLLEIIAGQSIEVLIIAGDIFDNRTPTLRAQRMYFDFLMQLYHQRTCGKNICSHVIVLGGNHDSPTLLEITQPLLQYFNIHVVSSKAENPETNILVLREPDENGFTSSESSVKAIVAAVPFLSDQELRRSFENQSEEDKVLQFRNGIRTWYQALAKIAVEKREQAKSQTAESTYIPLIATGHLFSAGSVEKKEQMAENENDQHIEANTVEEYNQTSGAFGDGIKIIYGGTLNNFPPADFPPEFDYIALGHIHKAQQAGAEHIRYCGSPIPIGFNETTPARQVILVDWTPDGQRTITPIEVPVYQKLLLIKGTWKEIESRLKDLVKQNESLWVSVEYTESMPRPTIQQDIFKIIEGSEVVSMGITTPQVPSARLESQFKGETLQKLDPVNVFERILNSMEYTDEVKAQLRETYREALDLL